MTTPTELLQAARQAATPNLVDRAILQVFPGWGRRRMEDRMAMALGGGWTGARTDLAALKKFFAVSQSPEDEQRYDRGFLVDRATDLERNDPTAGGAIAEMVLSVVGTGLSVRPEPMRRLLKWSQDQAVDWAETTKQAFATWAENPIECDLARRRNFYQQQVLAYRTCQSRGDVFGLMPRQVHSGGAWKLKLQLLEGDRVCTPRGKAEDELLSQGIEVDKATGSATRIWVCSKHPTRATSGEDWTPRDIWGADGRRQVLHLMHEHRIDLRRGYPLLAPVILPLKQLSRLSESELAAAVVTSFFAVVVKKSGSGQGPLAGLQKRDAKGSSFMELGPAIVAELNQGEELANVAPTRPNGAFDPFWRSLLGQIAMRVGVPPEVLLKKYESSYTAARAALLQFWKFVTVERENLLAPDWCQPIYEAWLAEAVLSGQVEAPGFFADPRLRAAYSCARWVGDNPPILDPLKEVMAAEELITWSLSTHDEQTMKLTGGDWETNHERLTREVRMRKEAGLLPESTAAKPGAPVDQNPDQQDEEDAKTKPGSDRRAHLLALALRETP